MKKKRTFRKSQRISAFLAALAVIFVLVGGFFLASLIDREAEVVVVSEPVDSLIVQGEAASLPAPSEADEADAGPEIVAVSAPSNPVGVVKDYVPPVNADRQFYEVKRDYADKIYAYNSLADIPESLPNNCGELRVTVKEAYSGTPGETQIRAFRHESLGYQFTVAIPDIPEVTALADETGYPLIAVTCENPSAGEAQIMCFVYNPDDEPLEIIIRMCKAYCYVADIQGVNRVLQLGVFSRSPSDTVPGLYYSSGYYDSSYDDWGNSGGETVPSYEFTPYSLSLTHAANDKSNLVTRAVYHLLRYQTHLLEPDDAPEQATSAP